MPTGVANPSTLLLADSVISGNVSAGSFDNQYVVGRFQTFGHGPATLANPRPLPITGTAVKCPSFADLYYNRIHFTPNPLALGAISQNTTRSVEVWSAYFVPRTLQSLNLYALDGVSVQGSLPLAFAALEAKNLTLSITGDGSPLLNGQANFLFDSGVTASLPVTGYRAAAFAFDHNWTSPVRERLAWKTEVFEGESGKEQRRRLRQSPRRRLVYDYFTESPKQTSYFRKQAWRNQTNRVAVPVWADMQTLTAQLSAGANNIPVNAQGRDYDDGGFAVLWKDPFTYEVVQISTVAANQINLAAPTVQAWEAGTVVTPLRTALLPAELSTGRINPQLIDGAVELRLMETEVSARRYALPSPALYRGLGCFDFYTESSEDIEETLRRRLDVLDNDIGISQVYAVTDMPQEDQDFRWFAEGRAEIAQMLGWLWYFAGRLNPVWLLSWRYDFELALAVTSGQQQIEVTDWGYRSTYNLSETRRDIAIILKNGTIYRRRITAVTTSSGREVLALDSVINQNIAVSDVDRICFLKCVRLTADEVEVEWPTSQAAIASWKFTELTTAP
jgi:hypothetical protein